MPSSLLRLTIAALCAAGALARADTLVSVPGDTALPGSGKGMAMVTAMPATSAAAATDTVASNAASTASLNGATAAVSAAASNVRHALGLPDLPVRRSLPEVRRSPVSSAPTTDSEPVHASQERYLHYESDAQASGGGITMEKLLALDPAPADSTVRMKYTQWPARAPEWMDNSRPAIQTTQTIPAVQGTQAARVDQAGRATPTAMAASDMAAIADADRLTPQAHVDEGREPPLPPKPEPAHDAAAAVLAQREPDRAMPPPVTFGLMDDRPPRPLPALKMTDSLSIVPATSKPSDREQAVRLPPHERAGLTETDDSGNQDRLASLIERAMTLHLAHTQSEAQHARASQDPTDGRDVHQSVEAEQPQQPSQAYKPSEPKDVQEYAVGLAETFAVIQPVVQQVSWQTELSRDMRPVAFGEDTLLAASDSKLDRMRGGFDAGSGLQVSIGITRVAYINGNLATTSSFQIADVSRITAEQAGALGKQINNLQLVQNGPGNHYLAGQGSGAGTVIQNTLNNQTISTRTVIDASANSAGILRTMNLQRTMTEALGSSLRR